MIGGARPEFPPAEERHRKTPLCPSRSAILWLLLLILFFSATNIVWLGLDTLPSSWDQSAHARFALHHLRFFEGPVAKWNSREFLTISGYWPPFVYWTTVPLTAIFGFSLDTLASINLFYLVVLVVCLYALGTRLAGREAALGAVAMTLFLPLSYVLSREVLLDFPLLAAVAAAELAILETSGGLDRKRSWLLGLAVGVALLVKWTAVAFLLPTWLFVAVRSWVVRKDLRRQGLPGLVIALAVLLAVAGPWYITVQKSFAAGAGSALLRDAVWEGDPAGLNWASIRWYGRVFGDFITGPLLIPFFITGIAAAAAFFRRAWAWAFLSAWIVPAWFVFAALPNKDGRFIAPLAPAVALLASAGIAALPWKVVRQVFWGGFLACGLFHFSSLSFAWPVRMTHFIGHAPIKEDWQAARIIADLEAEFPAKRPAVAVLANVNYLNPNLLGLIADVRRDGFAIEGVGDERGIASSVRRYPVLITKTGQISVKHVARFRRAFQMSFDKLGPSAFGFRLLKAYPLPDGSEARVYIRPKKPTTAEDKKTVPETKNGS